MKKNTVHLCTICVLITLLFLNAFLSNDWIDKTNFKTNMEISPTSYLVSPDQEEISQSNVSSKQVYHIREPLAREIRRHNNYWQTDSHELMFLYSAHADNRTGTLMVQVIGIVDFLQIGNFSWQPYCYLWFDNSSYEVNLSTRMVIDFHEKFVYKNDTTRYRGYIFSCPVMGARIPKFVSLEKDNFSIPANLLPVESFRHPTEKRKGKFMVCTKALNLVNKDFSVRLTEWLEMQKALGAEKVFTYVLSTTVKTLKILEWYQASGFLDFRYVSLAGDQPNTVMNRTAYIYNRENLSQKRLNEKIWYNDCIYRHLNFYEYITVCDVDEVIIPRGKMLTWPQLMPQVEDVTKGVSCGVYCFESVYVLDSFPIALEKLVPSHLYMMKHVFRARHVLPKGANKKCFYNSESVLVGRSHSPHKVIKHDDTDKTSCGIRSGIAFVLHYRGKCNIVHGNQPDKRCRKSTKRVVKDLTMWKYKKQVSKGVKFVIDKLSLN